MRYSSYRCIATTEYEVAVRCFMWGELKNFYGVQEYAPLENVEIVSLKCYFLHTTMGIYQTLTVTKCHVKCPLWEWDWYGIKSGADIKY